MKAERIPYRDLIILAVLYILFALPAILNTNLKFDEKYYHLPMLEKFTQNNVLSSSVDSSYNTANTPLPYVIASIPFRISGESPNISSARAINILVSIGVMILFYILAPSGYKLYVPLMLFFYPYFLKPSFTFYMSIYGLLFFLLCLLFLTKNTNRDVLLAGIFNSLAVLCQQFYLVVPAGFILYLLIKEKKITANNIFSVVLFCLPLFVPAILFYYWGGLEHPNWRIFALSLPATNFTSVIIVIGGILLFYVLSKYKQIRLNAAVISLLISIAAITFAYPEFNNTPAPGTISGYTFHMLKYMTGVNLLLGYCIKLLLSFSGCMGIYLIYKNLENDNGKLLFCLAVSFIVGFIINTLLSERHMLPLASLLILIYIKEIKDKRILTTNLAVGIIAGLVFYYYWIFLKGVS